MQRHRRGFGDGAVLRPQKRLGQIVGGRHRRGPAQPAPAGLPAFPRGLAGLSVGAPVVLGLDPRGEQPIQLQQSGPVIDAGGGEFLGGGVDDFDAELITHGAKQPLDLAPSLRAVRGGMDQAYPEFRARPQQPAVGEGRPVIDVHAGRDPAGGQRGLQGGAEAHGVLGEAETVAAQQPGMIIEEGEQIGFPPADPRAVQSVPGPAVVGIFGLEPAEHLRGLPGGRADQLTPAEQPQQGRFRGRPPGRGP